MEPLVPLLYNRLQQCFGMVRVAHQGQAALKRTVTSLDGRRQSLKLDWPGEYYQVCCPLCDDTKFRLWVNHLFGQPGPDGWPLKHLAICYNDDACMASQSARDWLYDRLFMPQNRNVRSMLSPPAPGTVEASIARPSKLPGEVPLVSTLSVDHPAYVYLVGERRFLPETLDHFQIGYCTKADPHWDPDRPDRVRYAQDKIIIPVYQRGQMMGWQTRVCPPAPPKRGKYCSSPGFAKSALLYNFDTAVQWPYVVVCEGPTDVWRIGGPAVATFGTPITFQQQQILLAHWSRRPIIFMLEAEGLEKSQAVIHRLRETNHETPILAHAFQKGWDPGELTTAAAWDLLRSVAGKAGIRLLG